MLLLPRIDTVRDQTASTKSEQPFLTVFPLVIDCEVRVRGLVLFFRIVHIIIIQPSLAEQCNHVQYSTIQYNPLKTTLHLWSTSLISPTVITCSLHPTHPQLNSTARQCMQHIDEFAGTCGLFLAFVTHHVQKQVSFVYLI